MVILTPKQLAALSALTRLAPRSESVVLEGIAGKLVATVWTTDGVPNRYEIDKVGRYK